MSNNRISLKGLHIIITGATRGIGKAMALHLAPEGVFLSLCGRDKEALKKVVRDVIGLGAAGIFSKTFDLTSKEEIQAFYREAKEKWGPPDILINNAGFNSRKAPLHEVGIEEFDSIIAVNLRAPFIFIHEALPDMITRKQGHIVNILSTVCHYSVETLGAYTAAKKGFEGLNGVLLKEARLHGIKVSAIYPGGIDTEFRKNPRPDYMKPESVAELVHSLLTMPPDLVVHHVIFRPMVETNF